MNSSGPHRNVIRQPLGDVQVVDLDGDFLAVSWFGHSDGRQILQTEQLSNQTNDRNLK